MFLLYCKFRVADGSLLTEVAAAQGLALAGNPDQAREALGRLWDRASPVHRLTIAHLQPKPVAELDWDRRALAAADEIGPGHPDAATAAPLRASLHVNAAAALYRLGRTDEARAQLALAERAQAGLPGDGYGEMVRARIAALRDELADTLF